MQFPVYLARAVLRDQFGIEFQHRERRLVRQSPDDRLIAVIEAPSGTRVRTKPDEYGMDQLVIPVRKSFWARIFGPWRTVPVKYVINCARFREHGLSVVSIQANPGSEADFPVVGVPGGGLLQG